MTRSDLNGLLDLRPLIGFVLYSTTEIIANVLSRLLMRLRLCTTGYSTSYLEFQMNPLAFSHRHFGIDKELGIPLHERTARITCISSFIGFSLTHHMHLDTVITLLKRIVDDGSKEFPTACTVRVSRSSLIEIGRTILTGILNPETGPTSLLFTLQISVNDEFLSEGTASHQDTNYKSK